MHVHFFRQFLPLYSRSPISCPILSLAHRPHGRRSQPNTRTESQRPKSHNIHMLNLPAFRGPRPCLRLALEQELQHYKSRPSSLALPPSRVAPCPPQGWFSTQFSAFPGWPSTQHSAIQTGIPPSSVPLNAGFPPAFHPVQRFSRLALHPAQR